jgi:hypothetical protein
MMGIRAALIKLETCYSRLVRALAGLNNEWTLAPYVILHGFGRIVDAMKKRLKR